MAHFISHWTDHGNEVIAIIHKDTIEKLNISANIIRDTAKAECPEGKTKNLKKSIRVKRYPKELMIRVYVGNKKAWYPHLVLFGSFITGVRYTKGRGPRVYKKHLTGVMPPNNFMMRAIKKNAEELKRIFNKPVIVTGSRAG